LDFRRCQCAVEEFDFIDFSREGLITFTNCEIGCHGNECSSGWRASDVYAVDVKSDRRSIISRGNMLPSTNRNRIRDLDIEKPVGGGNFDKQRVENAPWRTVTNLKAVAVTHV
jgi:hypothetical protein